MSKANVADKKSSEEAMNDSGLLDAVEKAIYSIQQKLESDGTEKVSLPDLARLLQLRRELEGERPRRVVARWIDECRTSTDQ